MEEGKFVTHRCAAKPEGVSIRKYTERPYLHSIYGISPDEWVLATDEIDFDYDTHYLREACVIKYCPFCGEKL